MKSSSSLKLNTLYLFIVQGSTYLLPLITFPYLTRILGPAGFGTLAFAQATVQYFILFTDYGFNLSASRLVAHHRNDPVELTKIFWSTFFAKLGLSLISFLLLVPLLFIVDAYSAIKPILLCYFLGVIGNVLSPIWFFQGMEKMRPLTISSLVSRGLIIPLTFFLVKSPSDLVLAALLQGCANLLAGFAGMTLVYLDKSIQRTYFNLKEIWDALKDGWHVFISTAAISLYTISTTVILGFIAGPAAVGLFNAASTIKNAASYLITPFSQALYPRVNALYKSNYNEAIQLLRKALVLQSSVALCASLGILIFAELIEKIVLGPSFVGVALLIRILAFAPFLIAISNILGIQTMLTHGYKKEFSLILLISGAANLILLFPLGHAFQATGAAVSVLVTETLVTTLMAIFLKKKNNPIFGKS
ncbi:flippase [Bdellovibrio sp. HCB185ZH]|uniref:flippase n=1 Tax=Bdellovibrio sp. HCB185ZH TaxID=3394235 RepID=UPI0039A6E055